ncbi:protein translocase SEC61 complex subunit gamma [Candidatus Woesearchaeota archaeon]|nr:protein translocase SEC61 complex subunit gamma [Candidatus Woesearchaeota archaeon]
MVNIRIILEKIKSFFIECRRVWQLTKKPTKTEWFMVIKVTGLGILILGVIGFIINIFWQLLLK